MLITDKPKKDSRGTLCLGSHEFIAGLNVLKIKVRGNSTALLTYCLLGQKNHRLCLSNLGVSENSDIQKML